MKKSSLRNVQNYLTKSIIDHYYTLDHSTGEIYFKDKCHSKKKFFTLARAKDKDGYLLISIPILGNWYLVRQHRLIYFYHHGIWPDKVDHKDKNIHNNMISNLRPCTTVESNRNRGSYKRNTSGYKNIYYNKIAKKYHVRVGENGKHKHIGYFSNKYDAVKARDAALLLVHKNFASK